MKENLDYSQSIKTTKNKLLPILLTILIFAIISIGLLSYQIRLKDKFIESFILKVKELDSELVNNTTTNTQTKNMLLDSRKYALPMLSCCPTTYNKKLTGREIGFDTISSGMEPGIVGSDKSGKKYVSINIYIRYTGPVPGLPIQVSAEDFSLIEEKGELGISVEDNDKELVPCELNYPRRSQRVFLYGGLSIKGKVNFIVDEDSNTFKLIYSPLDINEKATFDISTESPVTGG